MAQNKQPQPVEITGMVSPFVAPWRVAANEARIGFLIKEGEHIPRVDQVRDWAMGSDEMLITRRVPVEKARAKEDLLVVMDRLLAQGPSSVVAVVPTRTIMGNAHPDAFSKLEIPRKILTDVEAKRWANTIQSIENCGMPNNPKFDSPNAKGFQDSLKSIIFTARLVFDGDRFGQHEQLVHSGEPMIEFYDQRYAHTQYGQFVSRYYTKTLFNSDDPKYMVRHEGLCLQGDASSWNLSERTMHSVSKWAAERFEARNNERLEETPFVAMR